MNIFFSKTLKCFLFLVTNESTRIVNSDRFRGFIDELFIYNCSLNADQIRLVANTCKGSERKYFMFYSCVFIA